MSRCLLLGALALLVVPPAIPRAAELAPPPRAKPRLSDVRSAESRKKLLADRGGTEKTENAVADGLKWLASKQKKDGTWEFEGTYATGNVAATGYALLCFLGAGHSPSADGPHAKVVTDGVAALVKMQDAKTGVFQGRSAPMMYEHAVATLALVEAYSLSGDPKLKEPCQKAIDLMVKGQATKSGGWRYDQRFAPDYGDVTITGWVVQALDAARRHTDLSVPPDTLAKANEFVEKCAKGDKKELFAYQPFAASSANNRLNACTASGLCSKIALEDWPADNERLAAGVAELLKRKPDPEQPTSDAVGRPYDSYYFYYATRAVMHRGGDDWAKTWNPKLQEVLLKQQERDGCWPADRGSYLRATGRLGCTCFAILTLETYYRDPASKKGGGK